MGSDLNARPCYRECEHNRLGIIGTELDRVAAWRLPVPEADSRHEMIKHSDA